MPPGMGKQQHTMQNCITAEQIERGGWENPKNAKSDCEFKNFKMSGNNATYTMECKKPTPMTADVAMAFGNDSFKMDTKMSMEHQGQPMKMNQRMEGRYLGPCNK
jgi:hypothetical protein